MQSQIEKNSQIWRFPPEKMIKEMASVTRGVLFTFQGSLNRSQAENIGYTMWSKVNEWKLDCYKMKQKKLERMYLNKEHRYGLREKEKQSITSLFSILNFKTKSDATRDKTQQRFTAPQSDATWLRHFFPVDTTSYSNTVANRRCKRTGRLV